MLPVGCTPDSTRFLQWWHGGCREGGESLTALQQWGAATQHVTATPHTHLRSVAGCDGAEVLTSGCVCWAAGAAQQQRWRLCCAGCSNWATSGGAAATLVAVTPALPPPETCRCSCCIRSACLLPASRGAARIYVCCRAGWGEDASQLEQFSCSVFCCCQLLLRPGCTYPMWVVYCNVGWLCILQCEMAGGVLDGFAVSAECVRVCECVLTGRKATAVRAFHASSPACSSSSSTTSTSTPHPAAASPVRQNSLAAGIAR